MKIPVLFSWSGGKDSALALHRVLSSGEYEVVALLTTLNEHYQRVSMHGVRVDLLEAQAREIGIPMEKMFVSERGSNEEYAKRMEAILRRYKARGVEHVVFGDVFLADLRAWREANLARLGMHAIFPLWHANTRALVAEFQALGFRSMVCCVNDAWLDASHVGVELDAAFVASLPANVDPCGENGEYHSFAFAGPIFGKPIDVVAGEKVYRPIELTHGEAPPVIDDRPQTKGFWFGDLWPANADEAPVCHDTRLSGAHTRLSR